MSTLVPRLLAGRYEVGELIGRGGMAEVHRGHDTRLGRPVAIKILRSDHARDASFLHRFRREAQSVAGLNHPAIVAVYDSGEDQVLESGGAALDIPYIVMEFVEGRTLREVLNEQGRLEPLEAARVCAAVLDALDYSHQMGIVHRDIKPGNVMIGDDGAVKVMDFGIARAVADAQATMTQTQAVVGTAQYVSPEQARGETVDARSDVYSTGCLLFELLTGRTPFVGEPIALTYQHVNAAVPLPSQLVPEVPEALDAVVRHALTKDREERYQDAREMADDLHAFGRGMAVSPAAVASLAADTPTEVIAAAAPALSEDPPTATVAPVADDRRRRGGLGWLLAALLLIPLALLAWFAWRESRPEPVQRVTVEQLVGSDEDRAKAVLREAGLRWDVRYTSAQEPTGRVIDQDPDAGAVVDPDAVVTLTVSTGVGETQVPDLGGRSEDQARAAIEAAGLRVGEVTREDSPRREKDQVIRTAPAAYQSVARGTKIDLVLATGRVDLHDLTGRPVAEVRQEVYGLGLSLDERAVESSQEAGTILRQDPGAGEVDRGSRITVEVAAAPAETVTRTETPSPTTSSPTSTPPPPAPTPTSTTAPPSPSSSPTPPSSTTTPSDPEPTTSGPEPTTTAPATTTSPPTEATTPEIPPTP